MTDTITSALLARIKKLMALTEDRGATEAEAQAAATMASALLAEHNLSAGDISLGDAVEPIVDAWDTEHVDRMWAWQLSSSVAALNLCRLFRSGRRGNLGARFVGTKVNVTASMDMARYLVRTVDRLAAKERPPEDSWSSVKRYRAAWRLGCSTRLCHRLMALKAERERGPTATQGTTLPALASLYSREKERIAAHMAGESVRTMKSRRNPVDAAGYRAGAAAAAGIALHGEIGN